MLSAALGFAVLLAVAAPVDVAVSAAPIMPPCTVGGSTEEEVLAAAALKSARLSLGSVGGLITPTMPLWQWDGTAQ